MSKYANDLDMMSQALLAKMQSERDDAIIAGRAEIDKLEGEK